MIKYIIAIFVLLIAEEKPPPEIEALIAAESIWKRECEAAKAMLDGAKILENCGQQYEIVKILYINGWCGPVDWHRCRPGE